jgi:hypothetical protein
MEARDTADTADVADAADAADRGGVEDAATLAIRVTDISSATLGAIQPSGRYRPMGDTGAIIL